ncbi:universal stress protein [Bordetella holmesii]|uniref:Universal stress protein n=2 Tax=Bordetella holmesii TaxID=35814 RepID=A0A158M0L8_9BORD|nr:universal stress protein [Bordetella holmesii]AHV94779.1 universal stress family protein [Bordetella holmesii ATCC 51541]AIT26718.1 universal stress family protein [Bordetella holmesii 44057]EWM41806.1 universal stress family protein [Bordetella holmesii 41130]EWM47304.1 universal stress family protein [Bordetella holmesii 35009]EWM51460.1 universal stress family protein [Bordetella holmesii 70147]
MYKHILIPTDGSDLAERAVKQGLALARKLDARVTLIQVIQPVRASAGESVQLRGTLEEYEREERVQAEQWLAKAAVRAADAGVPCEAVTAINVQPYEAIVATARDKGCDLIAIASHGRSGLSAMLLGSVTQKVLAHSDLPVLVYR